MRHPAASNPLHDGGNEHRIHLGDGAVLAAEVFQRRAEVAEFRAIEDEEAVCGNGPCREDASAWTQEKGFEKSKPCKGGMMLGGGGQLRHLHAPLTGGHHGNTRLLERFSLD